MLFKGDFLRIAEIFILTVALSVDSLAAAISYGLAKIQIDISKSLIISFICGGSLAFAAGFAQIIGAYIPETATRIISFAILFATGMIKLVQRSKNSSPEKLSFLKTIVFAASMSVDGLAAGFGTGIAAEENLFVLFAAAVLITFLAVFFGNKAGLKLNKCAPASLQNLGGAAIIVIAVCKLMR